MGEETDMDNAFNTFRNEVEVGYWAVAGEIIMWKGLLLEQRMDDGGFINGGKAAFSKR